jgi:hypothetical protein
MMWSSQVLGWLRCSVGAAVLGWIGSVGASELKLAEVLVMSG